MIYSGNLDVVGLAKGWNLHMKRMSVEDEKISIDCAWHWRYQKGKRKGELADEESPHSFEAVLQPEGNYKVDKVEGEGEEAIHYLIYIFKPKCSVDSCWIEGIWYEKTVGEDDAEVWLFSGRLDQELAEDARNEDRG